MGASPDAHVPAAGARPQRRWLRFSIRHLIVAVTLIGVAFGAWSLTATVGIQSVKRAVELEHFDRYGPPLPVGSELGPVPSFRVWSARAIAPMLVSVDVDYMPARPPPGQPAALGGMGNRYYYLWLFGWSVKLPTRKVLWVS